ncbi:hypothetical protein EXIGLDRAFT_401751 [Exidia glandulosa HHB12029]|uniref:F-box domain-containing protein n=1 Tax=Exidia glandulosa HHB12029 TaxID=1314781 RepID=A0A165BKL8_EXIGL|nr:hypothetical protein EXIGLDRAFT_401751 [Exidia glandulosa HHB12029]
MNRLERYTRALPSPPNLKSSRSRCHISPPPPPPSADYTARLSPELLAPIFSYFHPTELGTLALVCRRWRDIVHHTPILWSSLDVTATLWRPEFFRLVLGRTKTTVELDVVLATSQSSHNHDDFHAEARIVGGYLKALKPYMGRVRRLEMQGAVSAGEILEILGSRAPVLRHLALWPLLLDGDVTSIHLPASILGASPGRLDSLTLGWAFDHQTAFSPAFHGLTKLSWYADSLGSASLRAVLRDCPVLRKLVLRITHYSSDNLPPAMHHLEELTIYQPVTRELLQDISHESIPLVSIASSGSNDDILSEEPYASWTSLSHHKFDSLSLMIGDPGPLNPSLLHIRYRAPGGIDRRASLLHLLAMDVLRGKYTFDHSSVTKLDIQDGCWPTALLAPNVKEVVLSLDWVPWLRVGPLPDSEAQRTMFGKDVPSFKIGTLPKLEKLSIRASFVEGICIDLPASHLLACLDHRDRHPNLDLVLGEGVRLVGPDSVIRELQQMFTRVSPPSGLFSLAETGSAIWWVDNWDKSN